LKLATANGEFKTGEWRKTPRASVFLTPPDEAYIAES
jgi:hypothetical protein